MEALRSLCHVISDSVSSDKSETYSYAVEFVRDKDYSDHINTNSCCHQDAQDELSKYRLNETRLSAAEDPYARHEENVEDQKDDIARNVGSIAVKPPDTGQEEPQSTVMLGANQMVHVQRD
ncbi:hypothetical protein E4U43_005886 [Claviceps pusilla]|uniref:Uncharacterized protein n=1 Tax=Claviceps pusilla TaxID=123648 RepID=A0A9P7T1E0_9HYPO|nr:hypothetical protein E4U43_005886 [Claviceps pusilla]